MAGFEVLPWCLYPANQSILYCLSCWLSGPRWFFSLLKHASWIDRIFYVWTSVFALFVVTVFWGFMSDCFDNSQGRRLFSFIAVGSSLGGMAGSAVTAVLAENLPVFSLLIIACVPMELASRFAKSLSRRFATGSVLIPGEAGRAVSGNAWSGMKAVFSSRIFNWDCCVYCINDLYFHNVVLPKSQSGCGGVC